MAGRGEDLPGISARINGAYEVLSNAESKRDLDKKLQVKGNNRGGGNNIVSKPGLVGPIRGKILENLQVGASAASPRSRICRLVKEVCTVAPYALLPHLRM